MARFIGNTVSSRIIDGRVETVFRLPAINERAARKKAQLNARLKSLEDSEIVNVEQFKEGKLPGQTVFEVRVSSAR